MLAEFVLRSSDGRKARENSKIKFAFGSRSRTCLAENTARLPLLVQTRQHQLGLIPTNSTTSRQQLSHRLTCLLWVSRCWHVKCSLSMAARQRKQTENKLKGASFEFVYNLENGRFLTCTRKSTRRLHGKRPLPSFFCLCFITSLRVKPFLCNACRFVQIKLIFI